MIPTFKYQTTQSQRNLASQLRLISARYRVDDVTTSKEIRDWTDLTPATSIEIALTPDDNAMSTGTTRIERRRITVETNTDLDTQVREFAYWSVENIEEF